MMKILHVVTGLNQGGAERQLSNLVRSMDAEAAVFSITHPGVVASEIRASGVSVFSGGASSVVSLRWLGVLRGIMSELKPDLIMGWMYHGNVAAYATRCCGYRGPILWNVRHSLHDLSLEKGSTRCVIRAGSWLSRLPARIIYNSHASLRQHERLGYYPHASVVLPNGFDLERFKPDSAAGLKLRAELGVSEDEILVGVVGRSHPMKNHKGWVEAFRHVVDLGYSVRCVMMGTGLEKSDSPVADAIRRSGLESKIIRLGPTPSPEKVYPALDLLAMPSRWGEGFPNVVGEAMACEVPAMVTPVGDAADVVAQTGLVARSADLSDLVDGLESTLLLGRGGLRVLGQRARRRMEQEYSLSAVASRYDQVVAEAIHDIV